MRNLLRKWKTGSAIHAQSAVKMMKGRRNMIRVTIWYEYAQEAGYIKDDLASSLPEERREQFGAFLKESSAKVRETYPDGLAETLAAALRKNPDFEVRVTTLYDPEYGLSDEILDNTDVLIWWAHVMHDAVPDSYVYKVVQRVQKGMGFIPLHSAHKSKPFMYLLGTSGCLKWREGDFCRVWTAFPSHPIAQGIPEYFELEEEEMYGEPFDIPKPDDNIFISWYRGGEVFRSGCTWTRGYGRIFYLQCGHETSPSYHNGYVIRIIENAIRWTSPKIWRENFDCPNIIDKLEK